MATERVALILGSTGATGKHLIQSLVNSNQYTTVHEVGRRVTPESAFSNAMPSKLVQHSSFDFEALINSDSDSTQAKILRDINADVVFITLGTTRANAGSAEAFKKIDQEYVVKAAEAAAPSNKNSSLPSRLIYVSAPMASSSSMFLYPKSKGQTEERLAKAGYDECLLFRPGYLANPERPDARFFERLLGFFYDNFFTPIAPKYTSLGINCSTLGKSISNAGFTSLKDLDDAKLTGHPSFETNNDNVRFVSNSNAIKLSEL